MPYFCIALPCLSASPLAFPSVLCHHFLLSSPLLLFSASYQSLSSLPLFICCSPPPHSYLWADSAPLFRRGYRHVPAIVTYFPCSLLRTPIWAAPCIYACTQTNPISPCRSHRDGLTNKAYDGLVQMHHTRTFPPLRACSTCPAVLLSIMNNALNRITFYHCIVLPWQWLRVRRSVVWGQMRRSRGYAHKTCTQSYTQAHKCMCLIYMAPETRFHSVNTVPNQYYPNIYQRSYHESHLVH